VDCFIGRFQIVSNKLWILNKLAYFKPFFAVISLEFAQLSNEITVGEKPKNCRIIARSGKTVMPYYFLMRPDGYLAG